MRDCVCVASGELGVALSGGGARALAQLGVIAQVLERHRSLFVRSAAPQRHAPKVTCDPTTEGR